MTINNNMKSANAEFSIGVVLLFIIVWGLIKFNKLNWINKVFIVLGSILFVMCSNLFIWGYLDKTPLKLIQFPFRFFGITSILLSLVGGNLVGRFYNEHTQTKISKFLLFVGLNLLIIIPWYSSMSNDILIKPSRDISLSTLNDNAKDCYFLSQYISEDSIIEFDNIKNHIASVDNKNISLKDNEIKSIPDGLVYTNKKLQNAENVILPEAIYKGLKVTQNGKELKYKKGKGNRILLTNTKSGNIEVKFEKSPIIIGSQWISVITTLLVLGLFIRRIRKE